MSVEDKLYCDGIINFTEIDRDYTTWPFFFLFWLVSFFLLAIPSPHPLAISRDFSLSLTLVLVLVIFRYSSLV